MNNLPVVYTTKEVAETLRCHPNCVYLLIASGKLPARKIGKKYLVTENNLKAFIEGTG